MTAVFKNPLPVKMSDITLNIESDELLNGIHIHYLAKLINSGKF